MFIIKLVILFDRFTLPNTGVWEESVCVEWQSLYKYTVIGGSSHNRDWLRWKIGGKGNNLGSNKGAGVEFHCGVLDKKTRHLIFYEYYFYWRMPRNINPSLLTTSPLFPLFLSIYPFLSYHLTIFLTLYSNICFSIIIITIQKYFFVRHFLYFEFVIAGVVRVKNLHLRKCSRLVNAPLCF